MAINVESMRGFLKEFAEALSSDTSMFKSAMGVASDVGASVSKAGDDVLSMIREQGLEQGVSVLNKTSGLTITSGGVASELLSSRYADDVIGKMSGLEKSAFALRNPELLRQSGLSDTVIDDMLNSVSTRFSRSSVATDSTIRQLYNNDLLGTDYGWQKELNFLGLSKGQQQRVLSDARESISNLKATAFGDEAADISSISKARTLNEAQRANYNKATISSVKDQYFGELDKWVEKQGGNATHQEAVKAYKSFVDNNLANGNSNIYNMKDARSFMQDFGLTPDEAKGAPLIARNLNADGSLPTEKNKSIAKRIAKHPVLATAGVMGTIWGVSELKDEDWS